MCGYGSYLYATSKAFIPLQVLGYDTKIWQTSPRVEYGDQQGNRLIYDTHGWRIKQWNHDLLSPARLQTYADAVYAKGAALENCFGFVDGTVRPIARPDENQRVVYNGHKRVHALKFQSVALPNGIIANMYGPVGGYHIPINFN